MAFNSLAYLLFLLLVVAAFHVIPPRFRLLLLLLSSWFFYAAWRVEYLLLLLLSTAVDYAAALRIVDARGNRARAAWLTLSVVVNIGLLVGFKYLGPMLSWIDSALDRSGLTIDFVAPEILLPIGISFYTFQSLGYTIDVYRGVSAPERRFGIFALYVSFFPQLVSGPIERSSTLLPQLHRHTRFDARAVSDALKLILWGLFLKVVVADRLALYVDEVFRDPGLYDGPSTLLAVYLFAFQVYFDFSAYTNIAIGSAKLMGFDLSENFARPYLARSIPDFWRRWHMSLTSWFRDYVYISLGGSRRGRVRHWVALYLVFFLVAVWHGTDPKLPLFATAHFLLYAAAAPAGGLFRRVLAVTGLKAVPGLSTALSIALTFNLVAFCWVIWWSSNIADMLTIFRNALCWSACAGPDARIAGDAENLTLIVSLLGFCALISVLQGSIPQRHFLMHRSRVLRWSVLYALVGGLLFLRPEDTNTPFIYFQF